MPSVKRPYSADGETRSRSADVLAKCEARLENGNHAVFRLLAAHRYAGTAELILAAMPLSRQEYVQQAARDAATVKVAGGVKPPPC
jgi:hypothetical protein